MKRFKLFALSSLLLITPLAGCSAADFSFNHKVKDNVESVELDITVMKVDIGDSFQLTPTVTYRDGKEPENIYKLWMSSNERVATVTQTGFVSAIGGGDATITFLIGKTGSACCSVHVNKDDGGDIPPTPPQPGEFTISLNATRKTLSFGQTFLLLATTSEDAEVSWSVTSGVGIVEVDNTGLVTAGSVAGEAVVTATANDKSASCTFTVEADPDDDDDEKIIEFFFFIDYNNVDETDTTGNRLLAHFLWYPDRPVGQSGLVPSDPTVAPTSDFPYFIGWSDHAIIDSKDGLIDVNTYTSGDTRNFIYIFGIWADVQKGEF